MQEKLGDNEEARAAWAAWMRTSEGRQHLAEAHAESLERELRHQAPFPERLLVEKEDEETLESLQKHF
jgi:hypothetical protein